ncbi:MAG: hypothetical protein P0Y52_00845 [Candidatus Brevundimonas phytovorans]|nr:hypothetical protein [Brevundimonas sp.]WEK58117.1 MAG: hypothetical protein P0Y52_00845 [Brevundimonas sp.]
MLRYIGCAVLGAPILMLASLASAQVLPAPGAPGDAAAGLSVVSAVAVPASATGDAAPQVLSLDELEGENGLQSLQVYANTTQNLSANNSGNTINAHQVGSGDITLAEGAFAGFAGIGNFVINSGHNNNLQGSLSIMIVSP